MNIQLILDLTEGKSRHSRLDAILEYVLKKIYTIEYLKENTENIYNIMDKNYLNQVPTCCYRQTGNDEFCLISRLDRLNCGSCYFKRNSIKESIKSVFSLSEENRERGIEEIYIHYSFSIAKILESIITKCSEEVEEVLHDMRERNEPFQELTRISTISCDLRDLSSIDYYYTSVFIEKRTNEKNQKLIFNIFLKYLFPERDN